jgi:hypothetical protein
LTTFSQSEVTVVEHHQEMQDAVARGAQREVGGVREDDAALAEELGEALAVQLRPLPPAGSSSACAGNP